MFKIHNGILCTKNLQKLYSLLYYKEDYYILDIIIHYVKGVRSFSMIAFFTDFIFTLANTLTILYYDYLLKAFSGNISFFVIIIIINIVSLIIRVFWYHYINGYVRTVSQLLPLLLKKIANIYRISLAETLPNFPNLNSITYEIGNNIHNIGNLLTSVQSILAIVTATSLSIFLTGVFDIQINKYSIIAFIFMLISFIILLFLGKSFNYQTEIGISINDLLERNLRQSQSSILDQKIGFSKKEYKSYLEKNILITDTINFIHFINSRVIPSLGLLLPITLPFIGSSFALILYLGLIYIHFTSLIGNQNARKKSIVRCNQIYDFINIITDIKSELTPTIYQDIRLQKGILTYKDNRKKDLMVGNIKYLSGRKDNIIEIIVPKVVIPSGKISILTGRSGIGKSIFGRLITLKYSEFGGEFIGKGSFDFRMFSSLSKAQKHMGFSGLREIDTSYRGAISCYLRYLYSDNKFINKIINNKISYSELKEYYIENNLYYDGIDLNKDRFVNTFPEIFSSKLTKNEKEKIISALSDLFNSLSKPDNFFNIYSKISKDFIKNDRLFQEILSFILIAEIIAFHHLKKYIPEATVYYMNAILSEPPISHGQRRRVLYALDILASLDVLVVDEPTANLDTETYLNIIKDIAKNTKKYKMNTLILEPKVSPKVISTLEELKCFGNIYSFKKEKNFYKIIPISKNNI